jgi:DNA-binding MltR family transcriptional regulator
MLGGPFAARIPQMATERAAIFREKPNSIKKLRAFYKDKLVSIDVEALTSELAGESDRAVIILLGTLIDDTLMHQISQRLSFSPSQLDVAQIFRFEGPLGTFSARAEIARLFGIINDDLYQQIDTVRELRNACAHSRYVLRFSNPVISNVVLRIFKPVGVLEAPKNGNEMKRQFILEALAIMLTLALGSREAAIAKINDIISSFMP